MKLLRVSFQNFIVPMAAAAAAAPESAYKRVPPRHISYQSSVPCRSGFLRSSNLGSVHAEVSRLKSRLFFHFILANNPARRRNASNQRQRASHVRLIAATISHGNDKVDGEIVKSRRYAALDGTRLNF